MSFFFPLGVELKRKIYYKDCEKLVATMIKYKNLVKIFSIPAGIFHVSLRDFIFHIYFQLLLRFSLFTFSLMKNIRAYISHNFLAKIENTRVWFFDCSKHISPFFRVLFTLKVLINIGVIYKGRYMIRQKTNEWNKKFNKKKSINTLFEQRNANYSRWKIKSGLKTPNINKICRITKIFAIG